MVLIGSFLTKWIFGTSYINADNGMSVLLV